MKEKRNKYIFRRSMSLFMAMVLMLTTALSDGEMFFGLIKIDLHLSREAKAVSIPVGVQPTDPLEKVISDSYLLAYLKGLPKSSGGTLATVTDLVNYRGELDIPETVSNIKNLGLASNATSLDLSKTALSAIPANNFDACAGFTSVKLPYTIKTIGDNAFRACSNLANVTINGNISQIEEIGAYAFSSCENLRDTDYNNIVTDTVKRMGNGAFMGCTKLTNVRVPALSTSAVPIDLFNGCTALIKVTLNPAITAIGDSAFSSTGALKFSKDGSNFTEKLPDQIQSLGVSTFSGSKITKMDLSGTTISEIKASCFRNTVELATIQFPETLTQIGANSFRSSGVTDITMPNSVTSLGENAFFNATELTSVKLSINVGEIPKGAFQASGGELGDGVIVTENGGLSGTIVRSNTKLTITWNDGAGDTTDGSKSKLKSIGQGAFNASNLVSLDFLEQTQLTSIAANAFSWTLCKTIRFPATLEKVGESALTGCGELTKVEFQGTALKELPPLLFGADSYTAGAACNADVALKEVKLPAALERIGDRCFSHCASLETMYSDTREEKKIRFPSTLTTIAEGAFSYCGIGKTEIPEVSIILALALQTETSMIGIQDVEVPDSVTTMGVGAFRDCLMLNKIKIGTGLREIPREMCMNCAFAVTEVADGAMTESNLVEYGGLKEVILPNNVTSIDAQAFAGCMALKGIKLAGESADNYTNLPDNLVSIGDGAFNNCKSLSTIIFPANLESIGADAFADAAQWQFNGANVLPKQYAGLTELNFVLAKKLEVVGNGAFARTNVKNVLLPASLKRIPDSAFEGCYNLATVGFHEGEVQVSEVGGNAFKNCYSLSGVSLPFTATWAHNLFAGYVGGTNGNINVSPTKTEENKEIIWHKETDFPFACLTNFPGTNLEVTDEALPEKDPAKNLFKGGIAYDLNKYVRISRPEGTPQGQVKIYGKEMGSARLKVSGTVDLGLYGENLSGAQLTTSYVYNISVVENPITSITLSSGKITEENGVQTIYLNCDDTGEYEVRADFTPVDATEPVQWKISDSAIATITEPVAQESFSSIRIKAGKAGDAVLTAYGKNVSKTINIKVRVPASEITLSETELTLATGDKQTLVATVKYDSKYEEQAKTYPDTYEFSSDNPEVATVDDKGVVTAVAEGTATITAKCLCSGRTAICRITVKNGYVPDPKTVTISAVECEMNKGETKTLVASVLPEKADQTLTWISSNAEVATVEAGVVTALKPGDVTITAQASNNVKAECRIAVKSPVKGMKILSSWGTAKTIYIKKGEEMQLASFHTNEDCTDILRFKAKEGKVASVDEGGHVIAKKPGKFVVKLQAMNGETLRSSAKITIRIVKKVKKVKKGKKVKKIKTKPIKKITIKGTKKVKVGNRRCLQVKAKPAKTPSQFTWECNKPDVATVDAYGVVTGLKKGKVKITVRPTKGKKKTITFKVK